MAAVIDFVEFKNQSTVPTLVLVGLHQYPDGSDFAVYANALANCRTVLNHAKPHDIPVAHVRSINPKSASDRLRYPPWIAGFEPVRFDMVFDLLQPSCYSNTEFCMAMEYSSGNFTIAGMFGETTCLSTAIDAHHRRHNFTYLADASACRIGSIGAAQERHEMVSQMMSIYGTVVESSRWCRHIDRRAAR